MFEMSSVGVGDFIKYRNGSVDKIIQIEKSISDGFHKYIIIAQNKNGYESCWNTNEFGRLYPTRTSDYDIVEKSMPTRKQNNLNETTEILKHLNFGEL